jgi:serine/threonine protein kinase
MTDFQMSASHSFRFQYTTLYNFVVFFLVFALLICRMFCADVKPSNILVGTDGSIKLCDFGISKIMAETASYSKSLVGSERYLPPERLDPNCNKEEYDVRSDVWAYGLTLIELATLKYPYLEKVFDRMSAVVRGEPPTMPDCYSTGMSEYVSYCLQKVVDKRPKYDHPPVADPNLPPLVSHPFILQAAEINVNVLVWLNGLQ